MTKLDELTTQYPELQVYPATTISVNEDEQRVVTLPEPRVEGDKIVWAEIKDLTEEEKQLRLSDLKRIANQRRVHLFNQLSWRYERHQRESRMGMPLTDNIADLDAYAQALADLSDQPGYPKTIIWPTLTES